MTAGKTWTAEELRRWYEARCAYDRDARRQLETEAQRETRVQLEAVLDKIGDAARQAVDRGYRALTIPEIERLEIAKRK